MASVFTIFIHDVPLGFFEKLKDAGFEVTLRVLKEGMPKTYHYTSSLYIRTLALFLFSKKFTINEQSTKPEVIEESECIGLPKVTNIHIQNIPFEFVERLKQTGLITRCDDGSYAINIDDIKLSFQGVSSSD